MRVYHGFKPSMQTLLKNNHKITWQNEEISCDIHMGLYILFKLGLLLTLILYISFYIRTICHDFYK